jgi:SAM-dependent methyltransferase
MATQFPDCQFIGFDTSLDRLPDSFPALGNVSFQVSTVGHDDKSSIPLNDGSVDVVNLRAQNAFLDHNGWQRTFEEAYRVLKPGGIIHIMEYCNRVRGKQGHEGETQTSYSLF